MQSYFGKNLHRTAKQNNSPAGCWIVGLWVRVRSDVKPKGSKPEWELTYAEARGFIDSMKFGEVSGLFGVERDESFKGS
jgi:hypothetical protein